MEGKSIFVNKYSKVRSGFKILLVYAAVIVLIVIIGVVFGLFFYLIGNKDADLAVKAVNEKWIKYFMQLIQEILFIVVPIFSWKIIEKKKFSQMGYTIDKESLKNFMFGLFLGAGSISLVVFLLISFGGVTLEGSLLHPNFTMDALYDLFLFILVGFSEETFFRGYAMGNIMEFNDKKFAAIASAVIFSISHGVNPNVKPLFFVNVILVGLLFSYMYIKTSSLWLPIGFHVMWDYFEGNVWGCADSGIVVNGIYSTKLRNNNIINGGLVGPEGGLAATFVVILLFILIKVFYMKKSIKN